MTCPGENLSKKKKKNSFYLIFHVHFSFPVFQALFTKEYRSLRYTKV